MFWTRPKYILPKQFKWKSDSQPAPQKGWECPRCGEINAPHNQTCRGNVCLTAKREK